MEEEKGCRENGGGKNNNIANKSKLKLSFDELFRLFVCYCNEKQFWKGLYSLEVHL